VSTVGWIALGVAVLGLNLLFWVYLYQREIGALVRRIAKLEHRLVNQGTDGELDPAPPSQRETGSRARVRS